ncbi:hypothetical protein B0H10DRAFT_1953819 [Mycena sp. CBHHK59/15]|nr:hypothetical protein B0H10DRAFT_1953819 [Mycena sp. CBHHK59/15]
MPAERTRYSRRSQADGAGIVWTLPVEPLDESGIAFAPNLTDGAFADLPPLVDAPVSSCGSFIFASEDGPTPPRRSVHTRKKSDNHIPRPPNAFILFRSSFIKSQRVSTEVETNHSTLSKIIGMTWKNLPDEERQIWRHKAMDAVAEHKRNFPTYAFRPKHNRSKKDADTADGTRPKAKKKMREVYQDPRRCEKIAELLAEGKKGAELDKAIQEFDKHHVPEIVTRFEAPITARAYRRSSSVPVPNTEESRGFLLPSSPMSSDSSSSRRRRSSSVGAASRNSQDQLNFQRARSSSMLLKSSDVGQFTSSFDASFSASKQEPDPEVFDFSSFSFSNVAPPAPSFGGCDPLSMQCPPFDHKLELSAPQPDSGAVDYPMVEPMDISAFIANEWSQAQNGTGTLPFGGDDAYAYPPASPAPDLAFSGFHFAPYTPAPPTPTAEFCATFKNLGFGPGACAAPFQYQQDAIPGLAQLEADLSAFMAQYSLCADL